MTCIEKDIAREVSENVRKNIVNGADFDMVFYADDTIVVSKDKQACEELLEKIETISGNYGLKLSKGKFVNLNMKQSYLASRGLVGKPVVSANLHLYVYAYMRFRHG